LRRLAAFAAHDALAAVLGDVCFDARQFRHLMAARLALRGNVPASLRQSAVAVTATGRKHIDDAVDATRRCQSSPVSAMAGLAAWLTPALLSLAASLTLLTSQSVRRRRLG
jgi:hypothetical protein